MVVQPHGAKTFAPHPVLVMCGLYDVRPMHARHLVGHPFA